MALITGLYKPTSGHISLGNCDITALDLSAVRGFVGVVEQTVGLLSGTITSNIAYGKVSQCVIHANMVVLIFVMLLYPSPSSKSSVYCGNILLRLCILYTRVYTDIGGRLNGRSRVGRQTG